MKLSLKPHHLKLYKDIVWLFLKYGHSDLAKEISLEEFEPEKTAAHPGKSSPPEELADDLDFRQIGPTPLQSRRPLA